MNKPFPLFTVQHYLWREPFVLSAPSHFLKLGFLPFDGSNISGEEKAFWFFLSGQGEEKQLLSLMQAEMKVTENMCLMSD